MLETKRLRTGRRKILRLYKTVCAMLQMVIVFFFFSFFVEYHSFVILLYTIDNQYIFLRLYHAYA